MIKKKQQGVLINIQVEDDSNVDFPAVCLSHRSLFFCFLFHLYLYSFIWQKVTVCNLNPLDRRYSQSYIDKVLSYNNLAYVSNVSLLLETKNIFI